MVGVEAQSSPVGRMRAVTDWQMRVFMFTVAAAAGVLVLVYATTAGSTLAKFNDFYREAWPAYAALEHGHVLGFLRVGPAYIGSLVLRVPAASIAWLLHGDQRAVYFASALPCLLAAAAFCAWLAELPRQGGRVTVASRVTPILCCIFNPLVLIALFGGHPEEILGAVLCVAAVVFAARGKPGLAGVLVGLAVVNKSWALVAVPVVLATLPAHRWRALAVLVAMSAAVFVPFVAGRVDGATAAANGADIGTIFNPPQLLWWLGPHSWIVREARGGIVLLAIGCAALWLIRRPRIRPAQERVGVALLLLALVLLIRAAFDPWNNLYYHVPFLCALLAYEITSGRTPRLTLLYTVLFLIVVPIGGVPHMAYDLRAAMYAATVIPTMAWMAARLYRTSPSDGRRTISPLVPSAVIRGTR